MIEIDKPRIEIRNEVARLLVTLIIDGKEEILWYEVPIAYERYLVTEKVDAFVVALLFLGMEKKCDIKLNAPISSRLYYSLNYYVINALSLTNPKFRNIKIFADQFDDNSYSEEGAVGTGLSCGIDSLATYYSHLDAPEGFKIGYFTFLNAGSHGDFGGSKSQEVFKTRYDKVKLFAQEVDIPLIKIDSNLSDILQLDFQRMHTFRNLSCILILQKLFKRYYYASGYRIDNFNLNKFITSDADPFYLSMLSTESTDFFSSMVQMNRVERTELVSKHPSSFGHLDVCTHPMLNKGLNCSECEKCLRTAITLENLGKLKEYHKVFDLQKILKNRDNYLGTLIIEKNRNGINQNLYLDLKNAKAFKGKHYITASQYLMKRSWLKIKKHLKRWL